MCSATCGYGIQTGYPKVQGPCCDNLPVQRVCEDVVCARSIDDDISTCHECDIEDEPWIGQPKECETWSQRRSCRRFEGNNGCEKRGKESVRTEINGPNKPTLFVNDWKPYWENSSFSEDELWGAATCHCKSSAMYISGAY
jgi:hypothetical protein